VGHAGPSFVVLDKHNQHVGVFENNFVIKNINGIWFFLPVLTSGFQNLTEPPQTYYTSTDCTGQPYFFEFGVDSTPPLVQSIQGILNNVLIYADLTKTVTITTNSTLLFPSNAPSSVCGTRGGLSLY
jgi:hypothetical protein